MQRGHQGDAFVVVPGTPDSCDGHFAVQEEPGRRFSKAHDHFGLDCFDLSVEERTTGCDFLGQRVAIAGRSAFHDIAYVDFFSG